MGIYLTLAALPKKAQRSLWEGEEPEIVEMWQSRIFLGIVESLNT